MKGRTPLMLACERSHEKVVRVLLQYDGLDLEALCAHKKTAKDYVLAHAGPADLVVQMLVDAAAARSSREAASGRAVSISTSTPASELYNGAESTTSTH